MYASYRTVSKAQGWDADRNEKTRRNKLSHRGMQKDHIQITPDGKVIQHYKMDSRTAEIRKAIRTAYEKEMEKKETNAIVEEVSK